MRLADRISAARLEAPARHQLVLGLTGGLFLAGGSLWLSAFVRGQSVRTRYAVDDGLVAPAVLLVTVLGLVLVGGLAVVLLVRRRLVTPIAGLAVLACWAFLRTWQTTVTARTTDATPAPGLHADVLFGLFWVLPLAVVLALGGIETVLRRRVASEPSR